MEFVLSGIICYVQETTMLLQGKRENACIYQQVTRTGLDLTVMCACFSWWRGTPREKYWYFTCENSLFIYLLLLFISLLIFKIYLMRPKLIILTNQIFPWQKKKKNQFDSQLCCLMMTSPGSDIRTFRVL